ncbi:elongation factor Ts [Candidatus Acetothermia bacterium]|nr:elongation factor Ts [Candidatus Acetothermia bacterium]MCI2427192.1 elongation factor Ts [Candidatus Acetothermia bacterium]MCI2427946.1 elongation factor Ts [Candidatus Acetothermia bacterium]
MTISLDLIKQLRKITGVGIMDCKVALKKADGDLEKAQKFLREQGLDLLAHKNKDSLQGRVEAYLHHNGTLGVLVEISCQTDFAANSAEFREFARNIAIHIAASHPLYLTTEDVPEAVRETEKEIYRKQIAKENKPAKIVEKIIEGRLNKFYEQVCLLNQPFVKDPGKTIAEVLNELRAKMTEMITIKRFARFEIGTEH